MNIDPGTTLEILAAEVPIVAAFVLIIGGVLYLASVILGIHERSLERHDRKDCDDDESRD